MEFEFTRIIDEVKFPVIFQAGMVINGIKVIRAGIAQMLDNKSKYYVVLDKNDPDFAEKLINHFVADGHFDVTIR